MDPTPRYIVKPGQLFIYLDQHLRFEGELGDGLLSLIDVSEGPRKGTRFHPVHPATGEPVAPDWHWFRQSLFERKLRVPYGAIGTNKLHAVRSGELDAETIHAKDPLARKKLWTVNQLRELNTARSDNAVAANLALIWTDEARQTFGPKPSAYTARGWLSDAPDEPRLVDMMSATGRVKRCPRLPEEIREYLLSAAVLYYAERGTSIADCHAKLTLDVAAANARRKEIDPAAQDLPTPSKETLRRAIRRIECRDTIAAKYGEKYARKRYDGAGLGTRATRILQYVIIDDTPLDGLCVVDTGKGFIAARPYLTIMVDLYSRAILAAHVSFTPPSAETLRHTLKKAVAPKIIRSPDYRDRYPSLAHIAGLPSSLSADNGTTYVAASTQDSLADMGASLRICRVDCPQDKAIVERVILTIKTYVIQKLPGATYRPDLMREAGYDPEKYACLTLSELNSVLEDAICFYHIEPHSGIGMQPLRAWNRSLQEYPIPFVDPGELDAVWGETIASVRLDRNGVRRWGLRFGEPAAVRQLLDDLVGDEPVRPRLGKPRVYAKVKYDPSDLGEIRVWNRKTRRYVALPCSDPDMNGISLWQHQQHQDWAKRENLEFNTPLERAKARDALLTRIRDLAPDMAAREKRAIARMLQSPVVQRLGGSEVVHAIAPARHDGMAPATHLEAELAATQRLDAEVEFTRPPIGAKPASVPSPLTEIDQAPASPDDDWSAEIDGTDWEEYR